MFGYIWLTGLREPLAKSAYRDIFINYTIGYLGASLISWGKTFFKPKSTENK